MSSSSHKIFKPKPESPVRPVSKFGFHTFLPGSRLLEDIGGIRIPDPEIKAKSQREYEKMKLKMERQNLASRDGVRKKIAKSVQMFENDRIRREAEWGEKMKSSALNVDQHAKELVRRERYDDMIYVKRTHKEALEKMVFMNGKPDYMLCPPQKIKSYAHDPLKQVALEYRLLGVKKKVLEDEKLKLERMMIDEMKLIKERLPESLGLKDKFEDLRVHLKSSSGSRYGMVGGGNSPTFSRGGSTLIKGSGLEANSSVLHEEKGDGIKWEEGGDLFSVDEGSYHQLSLDSGSIYNGNKSE